MASGRLVRWGILILAALLLAPLRSASAITRRDDRTDSLYTALASNYAAVGTVLASGSSFGTGTLIAPNYVLTAAHVIRDYSVISFTLNGVTYEGAWGIPNPTWQNVTMFDWDIAVFRLKTPVVGVTPSPIYTNTDELTRTATLVGYGMTGTGLTGAVEPQGTKRACQNILDAYGTGWGYTTQMLVADFDNGTTQKNRCGTPTPLNLEGLVGPGDSGGPVYIDVGGVSYIAGIIAAVFGQEPLGQYGHSVAMTRVSSFDDWINGILSTAYDVCWTAGSGAFNTAANWQTTYMGQTKSTVPGLYDSAFFTGNGTYTVTWPGNNVTNSRLVVSDGNVTFDLNARTYSLISSATASVAVGTAVGLNPSLTVTNGILSADCVTLGVLDGASGSLIIGSGGTLQASRLEVFGAATLDVFSGRTATIAGPNGAFSVGQGASFTKSGLGSLSITGPTAFGPGVTLDFDGGQTVLNLPFGHSATLAGAGSGFYLGPNAVFTLEGGGTLTFENPFELAAGANFVVSNGNVIIGPPGDSTVTVVSAGVPTSLDIAGAGTGDAGWVPPQPALVPEPATLTLLLAGAAAMLLRRRRA
jgi:hypothetical protein